MLVVPSCHLVVPPAVLPNTVDEADHRTGILRRPFYGVNTVAVVVFPVEFNRGHVLLSLSPAKVPDNLEEGTGIHAPNPWCGQQITPSAAVGRSFYRLRQVKTIRQTVNYGLGRSSDQFF
jgi:hypothetical protein